MTEFLPPKPSRLSEPSPVERLRKTSPGDEAYQFIVVIKPGSM